MPVYLFSGQEEFNIECEIKALKKELLDEKFSAMNLRVYNNPKFDILIEALEAQPLMFGNIINIINSEAYFFTTRKKNEESEDGQGDDDIQTGFSDKELAYIESALKNLPKTVCIIFVCKSPREKEKKVDTRKKLYKIVSKYATVKYFPQLKPYDKSLVGWITEKAKIFELKIDNNTARFMVDYCGTNLRQLYTDLEKLKVSIYPKNIVSIEHIKNFLKPIDNIFALLDLLVAGKKDLAFEEFQKIMAQDHPLMILSSLQTNLRTLMQMKICAQKKLSTYEIAQIVKRPDFIVQQNLQKLQNVKFDKLVNLKLHLTEAEFKMKTGQLQDALAIELALLS